ncbi:unnamed protein product [Ceratitis capitata]|uniref:(Mediterranean fruit fly) hypothetical protein n=1 Tax=Ceratitis capitata TaxID=7213 RepID=A0A811U6J7_CERCA|nr:unnamed protein product [Ceratitis capitata]
MSCTRVQKRNSWFKRERLSEQLTPQSGYECACVGVLAFKQLHDHLSWSAGRSLVGWLSFGLLRMRNAIKSHKPNATLAHIIELIQCDTQLSGKMTMQDIWPPNHVWQELLQQDNGLWSVMCNGSWLVGSPFKFDKFTLLYKFTRVLIITQLSVVYSVAFVTQLFVGGGLIGIRFKLEINDFLAANCITGICMYVYTQYIPTKHLPLSCYIKLISHFQLRFKPKNE